MRKIVVSTFLGMFVMAFTACSPKLTGKWNVQRYEVVNQGQSGVSINNVGNIEFKRNGTGEKNIQYSILGISKFDNMPFDWRKHGNSITISGNNTDFAKTWIIVENKRRYQQWKATDGANTVQVIELSK